MSSRAHPGRAPTAPGPAEDGALARPLAAAKFRPPAPDAAIVPRTALVDRLLAAPQCPIVCITAPPGYGKTTFLSQWAGDLSRRLAWVSMDPGDNDTSVLLTSAATALDAVEPIDPAVFRSLANPGASSAATALSRIAPTLSSRTVPFRLVLDHAELVENTECLDLIAELATRLPEGSQLALATRNEPPLPTALLRARRQLVEVDALDLAMDQSEASALLAGAGVDLGPNEVADLVHRTEGWPVGLYLAALAFKAGGRGGDAVAFTGDHRLMADYLHSEFLCRLPEELMTFLIRTAVLDRLSGPLCDAVVGTTGSAHVLESLRSSNLLLVPLDDRRGWYRYHQLFGDLLRAELVRQDADLVPELHERAATWLEGNRMGEAAIDHAQAAGDADRVARLVATHTQPAYASGRVDATRRWFSWFTDRDLLDRFPQVAVLGAQIEALLGHPAAAEHWLAAADHGDFPGVLPDGSPLDAWRAYSRALMCRDGVPEMRRDAELATELLAPGSFLRGGSTALIGVAHLLEGDLDTADAALAYAVDVADYVRARPALTMALGQRAAIAVERREWTMAESLTDRATAVIEENGLTDYVMAPLVHAVAARIHARRGEVTVARERLARAARLRPLLTYAIPASAQVLLQLGHAYLEVADPAGARAVLRDVTDILQQRPDLGVVPEQAEELRSMVSAFRGTSVGASSLTTTELRVIPFLATYLSLGEIAERMHVSRNTIKTHTNSIYQKLGVSSRSEANRRVAEIGLLVP